jgi:signal transduction histidine kinase
MRINILVILIIIGIVPTIPVTMGMVSTYENKAIEERKNEMQSQSTTLVNLLITSGYINNSTMEEVNTEITRLASIFEGRIIVVDNRLNVLKDTLGIEDGNYLVNEDVIKCLKSNNSDFQIKSGAGLEMTIPISNNSSKDVFGVIVMNFSTNNIYDISNVLVQKASIIYVTVGIVIVVFAFFFSGVFTKPFINLKNAIEHITEGYMDEEVHIDGYYEIDHISNSLNQMLIRMKNLERSRQEFVSNVSHELKTPLTSVKVLADSLLMQENASPELYREFLVDIADEIERENKIINDLLSLVKLDKTASDMNITSVKINELLEQVLKRLRPIAKKSNIELVYESFRPVTAEIDEVKLSLALSNLIENAIKYNTEDGWVRVSLNADHKYFYVKVSDSGIGIPEDAKDFIFDRFYRVDKARSRGTGGTGLGLSITKNVIHMHKGAIKVHSEENEGSTFTVRVPINYIV